jgi:hypothetical protein
MMDDKLCDVCSRPSERKKYCPTCWHLLDVAKDRRIDGAAARAALQRQWDATSQAFICDLTGATLSTKGGARNADWEHRTPRRNVEGKATDVALAAALVNRTKVDLTVDEWHHMIRALYATRIEGKPFDETAFPKNWQPKGSWNVVEP